MGSLKNNSCKKYFQELRKIKDVAFATVDENLNPQVRIIDVMIVEDEKLYFVTARGKDFYKELEKNRKVSIVGINEKYQTIRVSGKVKKVDQSLLDKVFLENPSMNNVYPNNSKYILEVFCLYEGEGEFFDLSKEPIFRESFSFGNKEISKKGFIISKMCIACGTCKKVCPQSCISEGEIYSINQENCLHCGFCFEECPVDVIERRS